ncbi:MAG: DNA alkylation repair protein [Candidatus Diapherotrites archaeon]
MNSKQILSELKSHSNKKNREGMARFGIETKNTLGVSVPVLRKLAKEIGKNHTLAQELWDSEIHEARMLACFIDESEKVTKSQINAWAKDFDSWDICDQCCSSLFDKTSYAWDKAVEFTKRKEEFVRRTGFVLMATLSVHDKKAKDSDFEKFFPLIKQYATDERNFVKKAVNWSLRQIGKRNLKLNKRAIAVAKEIQKMDSKSARWIANDALRELQSNAVQERLKKKKNN